MTGSGKTYTMEGFTYKVPSSRPSNGSTVISKTVLPVASFEATPQKQLGVVPRCIEALFTHLSRQNSSSCIWTVHASFVQLYKEQAYDLLNPAMSHNTTTFVPSSGGSSSRPSAGVGSRPRASPGQPLRMRWDATQGFYLENLFQVRYGFCCCPWMCCHLVSCKHKPVCSNMNSQLCTVRSLYGANR